MGYRFQLTAVCLPLFGYRCLVTAFWLPLLNYRCLVTPLFGYRRLITVIRLPLLGCGCLFTAFCLPLFVYRCLPLFAYRAGVDTRRKDPLLHLETAAAAGGDGGGGGDGVWPPPRSGRGNDPDSDMMSLEAPLLAPSAPPMLVSSDSDDCFLDDAINEVCAIIL